MFSRENQNGRITFDRPMGVSGSAAMMPGFGYNTKGSGTEAEEAIRGIVTPNLLNQTFFSQANIQIIQNKIRREVYDRTNGESLVDEQPIEQLILVMRAMYLQFGRNMPTQIAQQVAELNDHVAEFIVPKIISESSMYLKYMYDISHKPVPLAHPVVLRQKGSKTVAFDRF
jgi:hypothetical protein